MKKLLLLISIAVVMSACAPKQESVATAEQGSAPQATAPAQPNEAPTTTAESDTEETQKLPEGFPLPVMSGLRVNSTIATSSGDFSGNQVELFGSVAPEKVAEFYESEFNKRGLKVSKTTMSTEKGQEVLVLGESEKVTAGIVAVMDEKSGGSRVVVSWSERKK